MHIFSRLDVCKIIIPPLLASLLFVITLFGLVLPVSRANLLEQKKAAIADLTGSARSILSFYAELAAIGDLTTQKAQQLAAAQIRMLRYGSDGKDYFWITDLTPRMIMHPYRQELEGRNLADFTDPAGKHLFMEFVQTVHEKKTGYVPYLWQWKDIPERIEPKLSYVSKFEPWGWIIGTGIYLEDVQQEFKMMSRKFVMVSAMILSLIIILSLVIIRQGLHQTKKRLKAEQELAEHYRDLENRVEQRTLELKTALAKVKQLGGMLPICASCKNIRDDKGYWNQIESYIQLHSEAEFSHSICPECVEKLYPQFADQIKQEK